MRIKLKNEVITLFDRIDVISALDRYLKKDRHKFITKSKVLMGIYKPIVKIIEFDSKNKEFEVEITDEEIFKTFKNPVIDLTGYVLTESDCEITNIYITEESNNEN